MEYMKPFHLVICFFKKALLYSMAIENKLKLHNKKAKETLYERLPLAS